LGFISGTLVFAIFTIADKLSPSKVFFTSSIIASLFNFLISLEGINGTDILLFRFFTGFFLAGIYPVGMKIASDYFQKGLGKSLGLLVGALVLGTAFPHLVRSLTESLPWKYVIYSTSTLSIMGGILIIALVPDGPYRKSSRKIELGAFLNVFKIKSFRAAAFGYFGHMWELYAFWAFIPFILQYYCNLHSIDFNIPLWSFFIIAVGGISCAVGGFLSIKSNPKYIAAFALGLSGICCLVSPLFISQEYPFILLFFLLVWGLAITADSPMFSTLVAQNSPETSRGTALTIVNSIGFGITILSIQLLNFLSLSIQAEYLFLILGFGPIFGLISMIRLKFFKN
jgi:MFS family permease